MLHQHWVPSLRPDLAAALKFPQRQRRHHMRTVEIRHDPADPRPWVAIDRRTGEPVLRLSDRSQLEEICTRFEWRVAAVKGRVG
jgi:hypothetical protein